MIFLNSLLSLAYVLVVISLVLAFAFAVVKPLKPTPTKSHKWFAEWGRDGPFRRNQMKFC